LRALRAHAHEGDVLAAFSTSGNSANVRQALEAAGELGVTRIAFLGGDGGACAGLAEIELRVPAESTARVQEAHLLLYHTICEALEQWL
jgi:D-sedoheptulose 7-phosphate isomerase